MKKNVKKSYILALAGIIGAGSLFTGGLAISNAEQVMAEPVEGEGIPIDEKNFPDKQFRDYVSETIDYDQDGHLNEKEIYGTVEIDVNGGDFNTGKGTITSVKGIELFSELAVLKCENNSISEIK